MSRKNRCILVLCCIVMSGVFLFGDDEKSFELNKVVTTSNRMPTLMSEAPGNVSVMNHKEIKDRTSQQISDMISVMAGVKVDKDAGYNGRPQVYMRGIPYGTLIMLDGVILNDLEGEMRIIQSISSMDIDHVEVVRGPFSSLYGTGGIGGVINFITSMPTKLEMKATLGYGNEIVDGGAEKNRTRGYFSIGDAFLDKRLRLKASYGFSMSDGYARVPAILKEPFDVSSGITAYGKPTVAGENVGKLGRSGYLTNNGHIKAEYDWGDNDTTSVSFNISTINENQNSTQTNLRNSIFQPVYGGYTDSAKTSFYSPFYGIGWSGFRFEQNYLASISHKHYFNDNSSLTTTISSVDLISHFSDGDNSNPKTSIFGGPGKSLDNSATSNYLDIVYQNKLTDKHTLMIGFQARYMEASNERHTIGDWTRRDFWNDYTGLYGQDNSSAYTIALWTQFTSKWSDVFSTNMGLRLDYWQTFDMSTLDTTDVYNPSKEIFPDTKKFFPSPKFAFNYQPFSYAVLKGSIGLAFRAPNTREMYAHAHSGDYQENNPFLSPEYGLEFDIGLEQGNSYGGLFKAYYYQTEMFNAIYKNGSGSIDDPYQNINGGHERINGVELEFDQKIYKDLSISANYTYTNAKIIRNDAQPKYNGHYIAQIPPHMGHLALLYGGEDKIGFFGSLQLNAQSGAFTSLDNKATDKTQKTFGSINPHVSFDAKIGYEFHNKTSLSLSFLNFTNAQYYDYYKAPGASFYVQIGSKFF
ncbi:TonB-dependent receptor [Helicobacter cappadocius]|uniref:TonB-dependent receptor n=1 Tax=Helicobacter cappadocius TaxID=3063998 RepID=A0AA90PTL9_9HELI|nr:MULTISPECIES: TonB-dependent receptor [unclassified Helicobacter]MDO7253412.1 TonB-dependent receptor [Helicobacter sp. faydin-H75]MDP2539324.1 TonB-dependent receptor [Helicobacter sp. faydin-H76]